jgi:inner membrane protein
VASPLSHAVAALGIGACFYKPGIPARIWVAGAIVSIVPDIDVIGFQFGIRYSDFCGHRGFTHSLAFAAIVGTAVLFLAFRSTVPGISRMTLWIYLFLTGASHGVLDAMTDGGLGVAFLSPFDNRRYFLPWRPIRVSPLGFERFFTARGMTVLESEFLWIWIPAVLLIASALRFRRRPAGAS